MEPWYYLDENGNVKPEYKDLIPKIEIKPKIFLGKVGLETEEERYQRINEEFKKTQKKIKI